MIPRTWVRFFDRTVWDRAAEATPLRRALFPLVRVVSTVAWSWRRDALPAQAQSLTYTSLLALVPVIAVSFSLFEAFGGLEQVQGQVMGLVVQYLAPGMESTAAERIDEFAHNLRGGAKANAALATALLFVTVIRTLAGLEGTFNFITRARTGRSWWSRVTIYWAAATLGPIFLGTSLAMTASVRTNTLVVWLDRHTPVVGILYRLAPLVLTCLALALVYLLLPNRPMRPRAALIGGAIAGMTFEGAKVTFAASAVKLIRDYNQVYGSIALLFVFLFWMYLSWSIVLVGLELVVALQTPALEVPWRDGTRESERSRELYALGVATAIARGFEAGERPPSEAALAEALGAPPHEIEAAIAALARARVIRHVDGAEAGWVPVRPPADLAIPDLLETLRSDHDDHAQPPALAPFAEVLGRGDDAARAALHAESLHTLAESSRR